MPKSQLILQENNKNISKLLQVFYKTQVKKLKKLSAVRCKYKYYLNQKKKCRLFPTFSPNLFSFKSHT